jgi:hypothetical protein
MMQCIRQPKDSPIITRAMQDTEISQIRSRDVMESHVLSDELCLGDEVEDVDVFVELGPMVDQSNVGYSQRIGRFIEEGDGKIAW